MLVLTAATCQQKQGESAHLACGTPCHRMGWQPLGSVDFKRDWMTSWRGGDDGMEPSAAFIPFSRGFPEYLADCCVIKETGLDLIQQGSPDSLASHNSQESNLHGARCQYTQTKLADRI